MKNITETLTVFTLFGNSLNCKVFKNADFRPLHCFLLQTPGFFIKDNLKKFIVTQVISAPVVSSLVYIIKVRTKCMSIYCSVMMYY